MSIEQFRISGRSWVIFSMDMKQKLRHNYTNGWVQTAAPCVQWRRLHKARGHVHPHFYKWLDFGGGTVSRKAANKKLIKLYWLTRKRSPKRLIVLVKPKKWRGHSPPPKKKNLDAWCRTCAPHFQIRSGATIYVPSAGKKNETSPNCMFRSMRNQLQLLL